MSEAKAVLITGAARRIGRCMALHLAGCGYDVALHYHGSHEDAASTKRAIETLGRRAVLVQADLLGADYAGLIAQAREALPHLCALVHNASVFEPSPFRQTDAATFERNMTLHVKAPFFLSQAFAQQVGRGAIVSLLDTNITRSLSVHFTYLLSKKALSELTRMLAHELAPDIRVNAIAPGLTSLSEDVSGETAEQKRLGLPLKRLSQPEEIAEAAAYLLQAAYLSGHTLFIDGGEQLT